MGVLGGEVPLDVVLLHEVVHEPALEPVLEMARDVVLLHEVVHELALEMALEMARGVVPLDEVAREVARDVALILDDLRLDGLGLDDHVLGRDVAHELGAYEHHHATVNGGE